MGQIDSVKRSRDGVVRRANVRYFNHGENKARFTDRAVRSLVRLFNVEDNYFIRDMAKVEVFIKELMKKASDKVDKKVTPIKLKRIGEKEYETVALCIPCGCCCTGHCRWNEHEQGYLVEASPSGKVLPFDRTEAEFQNVYEKVLLGKSFDEQPIRSSLSIDTQDEIYNILTALEKKFDMAEDL